MQYLAFYDNKKRGFTLIELLVVIAIISLLSSVVVASLNDSREKARIVAGEKFAQSIRNQYGAGLILKYDFEGDVSTVVNDVSGNNLNGTITGSYSYVPSYNIANRSIRLSGGYITVPPSISLKNDVTFSIRFKMNTDQYWQRLFDFGSGSVQYVFLTTKSTFNNPRFVISNGGASSEFIGDSSRSLIRDRWYSLVVSIDSSKNTATVYLDGQQVGKINSLNIFPSQLPLTNNYIGKSNYSWDPTFLGDIDYVEIYNNPITDR